MSTVEIQALLKTINSARFFVADGFLELKDVNNYKFKKVKERLGV